MSRRNRPGWTKTARDENEPQVIAALEAIGCTVERMDVLGDILVGRGGKNVCIEIKRPGKSNENTKHAKKQRAKREAWKGQIAVVENPMQAIDVITRLTVKNIY